MKDMQNRKESGLKRDALGTIGKAKQEGCPGGSQSGKPGGGGAGNGERREPGVKGERRTGKNWDSSEGCEGGILAFTFFLPSSGNFSQIWKGSFPY